MGWLTSALSIGLLVAICSVHRHDTTNIKAKAGKAEQSTDGKKEDTLNLDLKDMMNMAKKYLGEDGVAKLMSGDYSDVERIGKQILGGEMEGADIIKTLLSAVPEGTLGKKLDNSDEEDIDPR